MNCPICGKEMEKGGLVSDGFVIGWREEKKLHAISPNRLFYGDLKPMGKQNKPLREVVVDGAYYCQSCEKITGIFDVTDYDAQ